MIGEKKIGLALSGGGYRAAAYHVGTMRALHKLGILDDVDVISSVSGGSITAAYYALNKQKGYDQFEKDFLGKLKHNVLWIAVLYLLLVIAIFSFLLYITPNGYWVWTGIVVFLVLWKYAYKILPVSCFIERAYDMLFFHGAKLANMPQCPIFAINSTDLSTGNQFTISQDRMSCYPYKNAFYFKTIDFPVSRAVTASSCVPYVFSPVKIDEKFLDGECKVKPYLVDGGLYDNQGAHRFEGSDSHYEVDYAIVSDAGNTKISSKKCTNVFGTLIMTSEIMMRRIKNFQRQHNSYIPEHKKKVLYVYNDLMWKDYGSFPKRFVQNIRAGYITKEVTDFHGITNDMISRLRNNQTSEDAFSETLLLVEKNIDWDGLVKRIPQSHRIIEKIGTNLIGLSEKRINALIEHSEWMTEVQVRLHLPFLIKK